MPSLNTKLATAPNVSANYVLKATTSTTIGNSLIYDDGTNVGVNTTNVSSTFNIGYADTRLEFAQVNTTTNIIESLNSGRSASTYFSIYGRGLNIWTRSSGTGSYVQSMTITDAGNVGIGVTSFSARLHVERNEATNATTAIIRQTGAGGNGNQDIGLLVDIQGANDSDRIANFRYFNGSTNTSRLLIQRGGNIGINITNPPARLTLSQASDGLTNGFRLYRGNGTDWQEMFMSSGFGVLNDTLTFYSSFAGRNVAGIDRSGMIASITAGADANYLPAFVAVYTANNNESNAISTAVSSNGASSGFRFDVSNGAGSTNRTASFYVNRGSCTVVGSLSKGSGSFKIDHPIESMKNTHHLVHSFVESPQANNIYRGKVQLQNGMAQVNLDEVSTMTEGTFVLLNREIHTYTSNETDWDAVKGNVIGNVLHIECQNEESNAMVSWLVIGERQDKHMMDTEWTDENGKVIVEPLKQIITTEQQ
jgi:hypothetical protein